VRVARKARVAAARRAFHEARVKPMSARDGLADAEWRDVRPVLDEELGRLPEKYRAPLVLCYLQGKTHEEAAQALGCPNGTVCGRLARARARLRTRLVRRGVALSAAALAAALGEGAAGAAVPGPLLQATLRGAALAAAGNGLAAGVSSFRVHA